MYLDSMALCVRRPKYLLLFVIIGSLITLIRALVNLSIHTYYRFIYRFIKHRSYSSHLFKDNSNTGNISYVAVGFTKIHEMIHKKHPDSVQQFFDHTMCFLTCGLIPHSPKPVHHTCIQTYKSFVLSRNRTRWMKGKRSIRPYNSQSQSINYNYQSNYYCV